MYSKDYLYTEDHEWIQVQNDICTVGITDFAQSELGEVVFVDLPEVGQSFDKGDEAGTLESVKAVAEFYTPITGEVTEVNKALEDKPELVNASPHEKGWLVKMRLSSPADLDGLMNAEAYQSFLQADNA